MLFETTWGMSKKEWEDARQVMRDILVGIAESGATITYGELSELVTGGHFSARSTALTQMLSEVCVLEEEEHPNIVFGSLVVRAGSGKEGGMPGMGYFAALRSENGIYVDLDDKEACRRVWESLVHKVWEEYGAPPPAQGTLF